MAKRKETSTQDKRDCIRWAAQHGPRLGFELWFKTQYEQYPARWEEHLEHLKRVGEDLRKRYPDSATKDLGKVFVIHRGDWLYSYLQMEGRVSGEKYTEAENLWWTPRDVPVMEVSEYVRQNSHD